jgi:hypothetical protein
MLPKHIYFTIYILWDRKSQTPYNRILHLFTKIRSALLRTCPSFGVRKNCLSRRCYFINQIADRTAISEDYHSICQIAPLQRYVNDEFWCARMCVCRNFGSTIGDTALVFVPPPIRLNHVSTRENEWSLTTQFVHHWPVFIFLSLRKCTMLRASASPLLSITVSVENNREVDDFVPMKCR